MQEALKTAPRVERLRARLSCLLAADQLAANNLLAARKGLLKVGSCHHSQFGCCMCRSGVRVLLHVFFGLACCLKHRVMYYSLMLGNAHVSSVSFECFSTLCPAGCSGVPS